MNRKISVSAAELRASQEIENSMIATTAFLKK